MMMSLIVILIIAVTSYVWCTRGFFSAFLHMVCTLLAGALAFSFWEPASLFILDSAPERGTFAFLSGVAWAAGLLLPFAVSLGLLRLVTDLTLPKNVIVDDVVNYIGGALCGLVAGVVTAGMFVMGIGMLRLDSEFMGHRPLYYTTQAVGAGSLVEGSSLWVPADKIVAGMYERFSESSLRSSTPLARYYPDAHLVGPSMRLSFGNGKAENTIRANDFEVLGRYTVGQGQKLDKVALFADAWQATPQNVVDIRGNQVPADSVLHGVVIKFLAGAKEKGGQVVIGNGQIRLVAENTQDPSQRITVHPCAVVAQAQGDTPDFSRFRFDGNEVFIASVGGQSEATMAFEFAVPPGYSPIALYVRQMRGNLPTEIGQNFANAAARDGVIRAGGAPRLASAGGNAGVAASPAGSLDTTGAVRLSAQPNQGTSQLGIQVMNSLGFVIQKGQERGLTLDDNRRVLDGEALFRKDETIGRGLDRNLRVDRFATTRDTVIVQVDVSINQPASLLGQTAATAETILPPVVIDNLGQRYEAVGFVYTDNDEVRVRFTPGATIRGLAELTQQGIALSRSRPEQRLTLIFRVSRGVDITAFALGNKVIVSYDPPVPARTEQR